MILILNLTACDLDAIRPGFFPIEASELENVEGVAEDADIIQTHGQAEGNGYIEFSAPSAQQSIVLDNFDAHHWQINQASGVSIPTVTYSIQRRTQGTGALHIKTAVTPAPANLDDNTARLDVILPESEDWSEFDFISLDIYMSENPTGLAEARLYLENSAGESAETPLILGWQLFQWENYQMTFPLKGNTYRIPEIPGNILSDVKQVGIAITRFSDSGFGTPYSELNFYIDNMRLDGKELWDSFDQPQWHWQGIEPATGITHNQRFAASAGSLHVYNKVTGTPQPALTDLTPIRAVSAKVKSLGDAAPLELTLTANNNNFVVDSKTVFAADAEGWETVIWQLPESIIPNDITQLEFRPVAGSMVYLDSLELVPNLSQPFDIKVSPLGRRTALQWRNPLQPTADVVQVWAQGVEDGTQSLVCEVSAHLETGSCQHDTSQTEVQDYEYLVQLAGSSTRGVIESADSQTIRFRPAGADYEVGFAASHGAIRYIQNVNTGAVLSTGSFDDTLWSITFLDEAALPSLHSQQFSPGSATHRFTVNPSPFQLIYNYNDEGRRLQLTIDIVPLDAQRFDLRASVTNQTGFPIRTVSLPNKLTFDLKGIERALLPIQEGLTLLPQFFTENRSTMLARPPMFADVLAYEGAAGHLAIHMIQDSVYQAAMLPNHPAGEPVFQPNNLGIGGLGDRGYFQLDMVTLIPDGGSWESGTVRISIDRDFRQIAADYRADNGIDQFPSLEEKLAGIDAYQQLAASPILAVEVYKAVEWLKAPEGGTWNAMREEWLGRLPEPGVLHLTHWQKGRDWYAIENENHKIEDDHPEALPIWWERYGSEAQFLQLLAELATREYLTMPFTNWTVWNTYDPTTLDIPTLDQTPAAATKLRGAGYPYIEYKGYMIEPWSADVQDRNTRMFETYTEIYPQDIMFVDMTGERSWRYVRLDDGETTSAAAYTQGVVNENVRLSQIKPLFTEGVFDRIGNSVSGYAQTLRQKFWNQILAHIGQEYVHWVAYPFAADVLHDKVAFYQHDLNSEIWPGESRALATYYSLHGYNYMIDVTKHLYEDEDTIWSLDAIQKSVNARTFGQRLLNVEILSVNQGLQRTTWGPIENPVEITANFDVGSSNQPYWLDGYAIAPDGFLARTAAGDMVSGIFSGEFNGAPLADGVHWITVEKGSEQITIRHPIGTNTPIRLARPTDWVEDAQIALVYVLADKSIAPANLGMLTIAVDSLQVLMPQELSGKQVRNAFLVYGDNLANWPTRPITPETSIQTIWQVNPQSIQNWLTQNTIWNTTSGELNLALTDAETPVGKAVSEPITLDFSASQSLAIKISAITPATRLIVQIQQAFENYHAFNAVVITHAGDYAIDLNQLIGLTATDPYTVVFWLEGVGASVDFQSIEITSASEVGINSTVAWQETFNTEIEGWLSDNLTTRTEEGLLAISVTDKDTGYGKIETIPLFIDINATPILQIDVAGLDAETAYSVQIQEQFGAYIATDLRKNIIDSSVIQLDLREYVNKQGVNPYRLVFWVSGKGSLILDGLSLNAD